MITFITFSLFFFLSNSLLFGKTFMSKKKKKNKKNGNKILEIVESKFASFDIQYVIVSRGSIKQQQKKSQFY